MLSKLAQNEGIETAKPPNRLGTTAILKNEGSESIAVAINPSLRVARHWFMKRSGYLGFLLFEVGRRDWKNVKLILAVGVINGLGWALCQNWQWAARVWPDGHFNFWRCWESSGGISIGIAYGVAYYLANRRMSELELAAQGTDDPNLERLGAYLGLLLGLGLSIKNGLKGWCNIYIGNERHWEGVLWRIIGPLMLVCLVTLLWRIWRRPLPKSFEGDVFPHACRLAWLMLIVQNIIAQLVTGPWSAWTEVVFSIYYLLLFFISAVIIHHYHFLKTHRFLPPQPAPLA